MGKSKSPTIELPKPAEKQQYSLPGFGTTNYANNTWGFTEDPTQQAYRTELETMRDSVLKGLGITSPEREASLNKWQDTFTQEALRTSMPQLEQTLFSRGLGGSNFYRDAVTDLLSKVATQGVLNRESLSQDDEALKLEQLASILGAGQQNLGNMGIMQGAATDESANEWDRWYKMLPLTMKVNTPGNSGLSGALSGAAQGASAGSAFGWPGTVIGGIAGAGTGYASSRSSGGSTPYMFYNQDAGGTTGGATGGLDFVQIANILSGLKPQSSTTSSSSLYNKLYKTPSYQSGVWGY